MFIPTDALTNGELASIIKQLDEAYNVSNSDPGKTQRKLETALDRLKAILPEAPSLRMRAQYPAFVEEFSRFHARSALQALTEECGSRGVRITPALRKIVASITVAGMRMGMVLAAELRQAGIDPVDMLYEHGLAQAKVDKHAAELRAVTAYSKQFEEFVASFVEDARAGDWRFFQGGSAEGEVNPSSPDVPSESLPELDGASSSEPSPQSDESAPESP